MKLKLGKRAEEEIEKKNKKKNKKKKIRTSYHLQVASGLNQYRP